MSFQPIHGGCQCGAVRYTLTAPPDEVLHCHCSLCRKASGALFASFGDYGAGAVAVDLGAEGLGDYESSPGSHRQFCSSCGCQLFNRIDKWPDRVFVLLATLDIGALPGHDRAVERHIFWDSRVTWYDVGEDGRTRDAAWPQP